MKNLCIFLKKLNIILNWAFTYKINYSSSKTFSNKKPKFFLELWLSLLQKLQNTNLSKIKLTLIKFLL